MPARSARAGPAPRGRCSAPSASPGTAGDGPATGPGPAPRPAARTARPGARSAARPASRTRPSSCSERRVPGQVGAQHQRVDEEPDQVIQRLIGPPRHRASRPGYPSPAPSRDSSTASAACTTMNNVTPCARASARQPRMHLRRRPPAAPRARGGWPPPGAAGQPAAPAPPAPPPAPPASTPPARQTRCPDRPHHPAAPAATTRNRRTAPAAAPTPAPGPPAAPRTPPTHPGASDAHRPAIARDVMHHHHQHMLTRRATASSSARSGTSAARSNGCPAAAATAAASSALGHLPRPPAASPPPPRPATRWHGCPSAAREHRPQHLMPADHIGQRRAQRRRVQVPVQPHRHRDVVRSRTGLPAGR